MHLRLATNPHVHLSSQIIVIGELLTECGKLKCHLTRTFLANFLHYSAAVSCFDLQHDTLLYVTTQAVWAILQYFHQPLSIKNLDLKSLLSAGLRTADT